MKMTDGNGPWGKHLIVNIENYADVFSQDHVEWFIDQLVIKLNMEKLGDIHIEEMDEPLNKGYSAFQMITTSHIAFHEDRINKNIYLDVFSCSEFEERVVLDWAALCFFPTEMNHELIIRE